MNPVDLNPMSPRVDSFVGGHPVADKFRSQGDLSQVGYLSHKSFASGFLVKNIASP